MNTARDGVADLLPAYRDGDREAFNTSVLLAGIGVCAEVC
jgi:hypothetical protein